jgi:hypothetical protein
MTLTIVALLKCDLGLQFQSSKLKRPSPLLTNIIFSMCISRNSTKLEVKSHTKSTIGIYPLGAV